MLDFINSNIIGVLLPLLLIGAGLFFIIYMKGLPFIHPRAVIAPFLRKEIKGNGVSPRSALWLALGGVLGVGNIVGVSAAIYFGGAGSVFWMCVSAMLAAILKYSETLLALSRRKRGKASTTADYIREALAERKHPKLGNILGTAFAILCLVNSLALGCVIQVNAMVGVCEGVLGINRLVTGAVCAVLMVAVSSGGLRRISSVSARIVPFMSVLFCLMSFSALALHAERIPAALADIFSSAFEFDGGGVLGGVGGFMISKAVSTGVMRGLISNEAGAGTSPMAHSASSTDSPAEQGFLGILEVFIDTVFLCTLTALVILVSYPEVGHYADNSVMMTVSAYAEALGGASEWLMCLLVMLFGLATVFCQCFYGKACLSYLTKSKLAEAILTLTYGAAALAASQTPPGEVWGIADLSIGIMTLINISVLLLERKRIKKETFAYFSRER